MMCALETRDGAPLLFLHIVHTKSACMFCLVPCEEILVRSCPVVSSGQRSSNEGGTSS